MAQFKYQSEMNNLVNVDGPLTKGPVPRWHKLRGLDNSIASSTSMNVSTRSRTPSKKSAADRKKTPSRGLDTTTASSTSMNVMAKNRTPSKKTGADRKKTPTKKTGADRKKTPTKKSIFGRKSVITPGKNICIADRFIPIRSAMNFDLGHYKVTHKESLADSPTQREMERVMCENLHGMDINKQKILAYQKKAPTASNSYLNPMKVLYSQTRTPASMKNSQRYIPQAPDRILDAPDIIDDYYLNLIDWSGNNVLAAALGSHVYLWDAGTGKIEQLMELEGNDYICSVSWIQEGDFLAVGTMSGTTELWDCAKSKRLRVMDGHSARVGSLAWNNYVLTSGCRSGQIIHHDVRQREHVVATIPAHTLEVCGLKWSTDGRYLASGGNDNVLNIWQGVSGAHHTGTTPLHVLTAHQAAVKALAWCPWQPHILASGGGTADRHIRFWNCNSGTCVNAVDTRSQVCSLLWSTNYKELISGHGFANNQLIIWKYPGMTKVTELTGHTARVLHLAMSPDGSTVLSAGADETLRLWKCFVKTAAKEKETKLVRSKPSALKQCIR